MTMDRAKVEKLRKHYPDHVPVICVPFPGDGATRQKLIMPQTKKGSECVSIARDKCKWASAASKVLLMQGDATVEMPLQRSLKDLDRQYQAPDGALYFQVEDVLKAEEAARDAKKVQEFKINEAVVRKEDSAKLDKASSSKNDPAEKAKMISQKHPDRVPVVIHQAESPGLPAFEKKLLVPKNMTCADLRKILPKHVKDGSEAMEKVPWHKVSMLMAGEEVEDNQRMDEVYGQRVDADDGGLLLTLEIDPEGLELPREALYSFRQPSEEEVCELERQLLEANEAFEEAREALTIAKSRLADEEQRALAAEEKALQAEDKLSETAQAFVKLEENLRNEIAEAESKMSSCNEEVEALRLHKDWLESSLEKAGKDAARAAQLQDALCTEAKKNRAAQEKISCLEAELNLAAAAKEAALMRSADKEKQAEEQINHLQRRLACLSHTLHDVETQNSQSIARDEEKLQQHDAEVRQLKEAVMILQQNLEAKDDELRASNDGARRLLKSVEVENQRLQAELEVALAEKNQLLERNAAAQDEVQKLKAQAQKKEEEEEFIKLGWNSNMEPAELTEESQDFGFEKVDSAA